MPPDGSDELVRTGLLGDAGGVSVGDDKEEDEFEEWGLPRWAVEGRMLVLGRGVDPEECVFGPELIGSVCCLAVGRANFEFRMGPSRV